MNNVTAADIACGQKKADLQVQVRFLEASEA
jgi:hypothetical protein